MPPLSAKFCVVSSSVGRAFHREERRRFNSFGQHHFIPISSNWQDNSLFCASRCSVRKSQLWFESINGCNYIRVAQWQSTILIRLRFLVQIQTWIPHPRSSTVEQNPYKIEVFGSNPNVDTNFGKLAQW